MFFFQLSCSISSAHLIQSLLVWFNESLICFRATVGDKKNKAVISLDKIVVLRVEFYKKSQKIMDVLYRTTHMSVCVCSCVLVVEHETQTIQGPAHQKH